MRFVLRRPIHFQTRRFVRVPMRAKVLQREIYFPGEDAPGTGRRQFPRKEERVIHKARVENQDKHHLITTEDYYAVFPFWIHTSCPLEITDRIPSGMSIRHEPDAGPATGKRRPPEAFNTEPVNLDPVRAETVEERLRSVRIRRSC